MPNKKTIYILLTMFLGLLLFLIAHALVELWLVNFLLAKGLVPEGYNFFGSNCFLPLYVQLAFLIFGLLGGYFLGRTWWRIVYIEHRHWKGKYSF